MPREHGLSPAELTPQETKEPFPQTSRRSKLGKSTRDKHKRENKILKVGEKCCLYDTKTKTYIIEVKVIKVKDDSERSYIIQGIQDPTRINTRNRIYLKRIKKSSTQKTTNGIKSSIAKKKDPAYIFRAIRFNSSWGSEVDKWKEEKKEKEDKYEEFINKIEEAGMTKAEWENHANIAKYSVDTGTFLKLGIIRTSNMKKEEVETSSSDFPGETCNTDPAVTQHAVPDSCACALQA